MADNPSAGYWNPAGLSYLMNYEFIGSYSVLSMDRKYNYLALGLPVFSKASVSINWLNYKIDDIEGRNNIGLITNTFSNSQDAILVSLGYRFLENISFGATIKYISHSLSSYQSQGIGLDLGFISQLSKSLRIGCAIQDFNTQVKWNTESRLTEKYPYIIRLGLFYQLPVARIKYLMDIEKMKSQNPILHTGMEVPVIDQFGIRLGFNQKSLCGGGYLKIPISGVFMKLDYGLGKESMDEILIQRISIHLSFSSSGFSADKYDKINKNRVENSIIINPKSIGVIVKLVDKYPDYALINAGFDIHLKKDTLLRIFREELVEFEKRREFIGYAKVMKVTDKFSAISIEWIRKGYTIKMGDCLYDVEDPDEVKGFIENQRR